MEKMVFADKLLNLCYQFPDQLADQWCKAVTTNVRTTTFHTVPQNDLQKWAISIYQNMRQMYFAKSPYDEVMNYLDRSGCVEDLLNKGVKLSDAVYAVILLRRHMWLFAEKQAIFFNTPTDIFQQADSLNRALLVFDYFLYAMTEKYTRISASYFARQSRIPIA